MRKALCWLLICLCLVTGASAEVSLLPQLQQWDTTQPVEISLSADVKTHMPFDDDRCAQLNALLSHVSLKLGISTEDQAEISSLAVCVDEREALQVLQKEAGDTAQLQLSWMPDLTITGGPNVLAELLGQNETEESLYGFTGTETAWLDDGAVMVSSIGESLESYGKETAIKTNIKNMGTARRKITYTIPKDEMDVFVQAIAKHCPEGDAKGFLTNLTYSGQQKLILWLTEDGQVIRAEYAGRCGMDADTLRQVSLKWRMRRDENSIRDDLTLKTPAVKGNDYNTVTCIRDLIQNESGAVTYALDYSETVRSGKSKSTRAAEIELYSVAENDASRLTGSVMVKQKLPGADSEVSMTFKPDVLVGIQAGTPALEGTLSVQEKRGKAVLEEAVISIKAGAGVTEAWQQTENEKQLAGMTEEERSGILEGMASALVPHLVLVPQEDSLYLSADLPEDVWQGIVEAARSVLPEEVEQ